MNRSVDLRVSSSLASLHHCVVALEARGWGTEVHRFPAQRSDHLAEVEVFPRAPDPLDLALVRAIPRRRTDRRPYSAESVPFAAITLMGPARPEPG